MKRRYNNSNSGSNLQEMIEINNNNNHNNNNNRTNNNNNNSHNNNNNGNNDNNDNGSAEHASKRIRLDDQSTTLSLLSSLQSSSTLSSSSLANQQQSYYFDHHDNDNKNNNNYCWDRDHCDYTVVLCGFGDDSLGQLSIRKFMLPNQVFCNRRVDNNQQPHQRINGIPIIDYCCTPSVYNMRKLLGNDYEQISKVFCGDSCSFFQTQLGNLKICGDQETSQIFSHYCSSNGSNGSNGSYSSSYSNSNSSNGGNNNGMSSIGNGSSNGSSHGNGKNGEVLLNNSIKKIACGSFFVVLLTLDNQVYVVGDNQSGNLGVGTFDNLDTIEKLDLSENRVVGSNNAIVDVACGEYFSMFRAQDGRIFACGSNEYGQLGLGPNHQFSNVLVPVMMDEIIRAKETIERIVCGASFHVLLSNKGNIWVCGDNVDGQIGLSSDINKVMQPTLIREFEGNVRDVACGFQHMIIRTKDQRIFACGSNGFGQTGVHVDTSPIFQFKIVPDNESTQFYTNRITKIICAGHRSFFASDENEIWACGYNRNGQLGLGHNVESVRVPSKLDYLTSLRLVREQHPSLIPSTKVVSLDIVSSLDHNFLVITVESKSTQRKLWNMRKQSFFCDASIICQK